MRYLFQTRLKFLIRWYGTLVLLPFRFFQSKIPPPRQVSHAKWVEYLSSNFNKPGLRVLEIGSRNVTGSNFRSKFGQATYVGFDFYEGENVDIQGDVHALTKYFEGEEKFDLIFSSAVFEHLSMPWMAAVEINKMLKVGGYVFIETHFSFSSHERPSHFFQFSDMGLRALFNDQMGFDLIDSGMSNPIIGFYASGSDPQLRHRPVTELYCHSEILCRKRCNVGDFMWGNIPPQEVADGAQYPSPTS